MFPDTPAAWLKGSPASCGGSGGAGLSSSDPWGSPWSALAGTAPKPCLDTVPILYSLTVQRSACHNTCFCHITLCHDIMQGKVTKICDWNVVLVVFVFFFPSKFHFSASFSQLLENIMKTHRLNQVERLNRKEVMYLLQSNHPNKYCQPFICLCAYVKEGMDDKRKIGSESTKRKNLNMKKGNLKTYILQTLWCISKSHRCSYLRGKNPKNPPCIGVDWTRLQECSPVCKLASKYVSYKILPFFCWNSKAERNVELK